jgi:hypothetical protein
MRTTSNSTTARHQTLCADSRTLLLLPQLHQLGTPSTYMLGHPRCSVASSSFQSRMISTTSNRSSGKGHCLLTNYQWVCLCWW